MRRILALCLGIWAAGCSDATGPGRDPSGTFDLISMDGQPLPYANGGVRVLGGILILDGDDRWTLETSLQYGAATGPIAKETGGGRYDHDGEEIELSGDLEATAVYDGTSILLPLIASATGDPAGVAMYARRP